MKKKKLVLLGLACAVALVSAVGVRGDGAGEIGRLAELMGWKAGTVVERRLRNSLGFKNRSLA